MELIWNWNVYGHIQEQKDNFDIQKYFKVLQKAWSLPKKPKDSSFNNKQK